jgi:hypothetical protein
MGTAINRLDSHTLHQGSDVKATNPEAFAHKKALQHPASRKRVIQMQLIYPSHQTQIGLTDRFSPIIDAATADAQDPSLFGDR